MSPEASLWDSEEDLRSLFQEAPVAYHEIDSEGVIRRVNNAECSLLGFERSEILGKYRWDFVAPEEQESSREALRRKISGEQPIAPFEREIIGRNGARHVVEIHESLIRDQSGRVVGVRAAMLDITKRKQAEEARRETEERYELAVRGANDGLWDWNLKTDKIYFSPRWKAMLGYEEGEIGDSPEEWFGRVHPEDLGRLKVEIGVHLEGHNQHFENEHRMRHKDGSYRWVVSRALAVVDAQGKALRIAGSQTDITMRKLAEQRLLHDAFHDELTGLPNRALFMERLERAAVRAVRRDNYLFAVLFLDLDRFKVINDSLGHMIGDQLLVGIARRLESCLRPEDTVTRLGGDEFVILFDDLKGISDATQLAERIQQELGRPFQLGGHEVFTTASIGIALSETGYQRPEDLLRDADTVMYRAKALGKARHEVFHTGLHARAVERLQLETDLRRAVERQELLVHYQPIVSRESGAIAAVEALVRWQHPQRGLVPPANFISVAEETGIILSIGDWVLRTACAQNKAWHDAGHPHLRVAVNLSARQFKQPSLVDAISRALEDTGLDPRFLDLELTENIVLGNAQATIETMQQLCAMGIRISIDDFGTGYSSLRYLRRFPISTLKIDRSFVRDIDVDPDGAAIATAVINLGHSLRLNVVAEGVETTEQLEFLCAGGCNQIQGYVFSRPLPPEQIAGLLKSRYLMPGPARAKRVGAPPSLLTSPIAQVS